MVRPVTGFLDRLWEKTSGPGTPLDRLYAPTNNVRVLQVFKLEVDLRSSPTIHLKNYPLKLVPESAALYER